MLLGGQQLFGSLSKSLINSNIVRVRRYLGFATMILPIDIFIFYFTDLSLLDKCFATAVNLSGFYLITFFLAISFLYVLNKHIVFMSFEIKVSCIAFSVYNLLVWIPLLFDDIHFIYTCHVIANTLLAINILFVIYYVYIEYSRINVESDIEYFSILMQNLKIIKKCFVYIIILGIFATVGPVLSHYSLYFPFIFLIYSLWVFIYLNDSVNKLAHFMKTENVCTSAFDRANEDVDKDEKMLLINEENTGSSSLSPEISERISEQLDKWIEKKGYMKNGVTVQSIAYEVFTNRTYLSIYINATYNCSFKVWVTRLRIDEAKKLLRHDKNHSISDIAIQVGFSSPTSFIHVFTRYEKITPTKWRFEHKLDKIDTKLQKHK